MENKLQLRIEPSGVSFALPGCQDYYYPDAPKLPYLPLTLTLKPNEKISSVSLRSLQVVSVPKPRGPLLRFDPLQATNGEFAPPILSPLPSLFPEGSFSICSVGDGSERTAKLKIFPVHLYHDSVYLTTQITLSVLISQEDPIKVLVGPPRKGASPYSVILAPDEWVEEAHNLLLYHQKEGYRAEVVPLSQLADYPLADPLEIEDVSTFLDVSPVMKKRFLSYDSDLARKIRQFLIDRLLTRSVDYLTILGDATAIPPSEYIFSTYNPDTYDRAIPTDFFYMAPGSSGVDYSPLLSVGRIPVRTKQEMKDYLTKLRDYRGVCNQQWRASVTLFGGDLFHDDYYGEIQSNFMINEHTFSGQRVTKKYQSDGLYKRDSILSTLEEEDTGFLVMGSHGRGDYLRLPYGFVDSTDILSLPKKAKLPIFVSDACLNGAFDTRLSGIRYGTDAHLPLPTSFAQSLLLSKGGAIAYLGGSRINYAGMDYSYREGVVTSDCLFNTDAMLHYILASYGEKDTTLGEMAKKGVAQYLERDMGYPGDWLLKALYGFCLLGDPTHKLPGKRSKPSPSIDFTEVPTLFKNPFGEIPKISQDLLNEVVIQSSEKELTFRVSDYNTWENPLLITKKITTDDKNKATEVLPTIQKSRICVKVETPCGKEARFVAYTNFHADLRLSSPPVFLRQPLGSKKQVLVNLENVGVKPARDIYITAESKGEVLLEKKIPTLILYQQYPLSLTLSFTTLGPCDVLFRCSLKEGEKDVTDNTVLFSFQVIEGAIERIGLFKSSYVENLEDIREAVWLEKVNEVFQTEHLAYELRLIQASELLSLESLELDLLVLYDSSFFSSEGELVAKLKEFSEKGGKVLIIGPSPRKIRALVGIKSVEQFCVHQGDSSFQPFSLLRSASSFFTNPTVSLPIFEAYVPETRSLTEVISEETNILGVSEDEWLSLSVRGSYFYFSGLVSQLDFNRKSAVFTFFVDLLILPLKYQYVSKSLSYALSVPV